MTGDRTPLADFLLYTAVVVIIFHAVLFGSAPARLATLLTSAGLSLDVLGAALLAIGLLWRDMTTMRAAEMVVTRGGEGAPHGAAAKAAVWFGVQLGSRDVRAASPGLIENYTWLPCSDRGRVAWTYERRELDGSTYNKCLDHAKAAGYQEVK